MILDMEICTRYQKPEQIDTVIPLYRGDYTAVRKHGTVEYRRLIQYHMY